MRTALAASGTELKPAAERIQKELGAHRISTRSQQVDRLARENAK